MYGFDIALCKMKSLSEEKNFMPETHTYLNINQNKQLKPWMDRNFIMKIKGE